MGQEEKAKIDEIYHMLMEMHGDMKAYKVTQENHRDGILDLAAQVREHRKIQETIVADRNKVIGVSWVGAIIAGVTAICTALASLIKHVN